jgi:hypothetical protein
LVARARLRSDKAGQYCSRCDDSVEDAQCAPSARQSDEDEHGRPRARATSVRRRRRVRPLSRDAADEIVQAPAGASGDDENRRESKDGAGGGGVPAAHIIVPAGAHLTLRGAARFVPPPSPPKSPDTTDLRRAKRVKRKSRAQLLLYPSGRHPHPIDVTVIDYSATGIGIVHTEGLLVGQKFIVREPYVTRDNTCLFTVVRSEPRPDGTFSIGMHIGNSLADEHDPLLTIEPAPGISLGSKLLFLAFAVLGVTTIVLVTLRHYWYPGTDEW